MWLHKSGMLAVAGKVAVGKAVTCSLVVCTLAVDVAVMGQPYWQKLSFLLPHVKA